MNFRLLFKMSSLGWFRSFTLQSLISLALAQLFLGVWLGGAIDHEIRRTEKFSAEAKWITIQLKDETKPEALIETLKNAGDSYSVEVFDSDAVLTKMETEEPEVVQMVKTMGKEGLQLVPQVLLMRGKVSDEILSMLKTRPEVFKVEVSPVYHYRLQAFFKHLKLEMRIALFMILFLMIVIILAAQKIQNRDLQGVKENLIMWGSNRFHSQLPLLVSLLMMGVISVILSLVEWSIFKKILWQKSPFLGELSIDQSLHFPTTLALGVFFGMILWVMILGFSGSSKEE